MISPPKPAVQGFVFLCQIGSPSWGTLFLLVLMVLVGHKALSPLYGKKEGSLIVVCEIAGDRALVDSFGVSRGYSTR